MLNDISTLFVSSDVGNLNRIDLIIFASLHDQIETFAIGGKKGPDPPGDFLIL
jgi:hypothetical protein